MRTTAAAAALRLVISVLLSRIAGSSSSSSGNVLLGHYHHEVDSRHASPPSPLLLLHAKDKIEDDGGRQKLRGDGRKRQRRQVPTYHHQRSLLESAGSSGSSSAGGACVTAGCATSGTCNDSIQHGCTVPSELVCEHRWPAYNVCESPPVSSMLPCWMAAVDGSLTLNAISIPGTHDTMAKGSSACLQEGIGDLVYTQTWSLRTMLDAGVRALDIRLRHEDDTFTLEHGIIALPYTFDEDVRDVLVAFVQDNPSETVLMFYQVNDLESNTRTWEESLQESLDAYPGIWITGTTIPTLEEARGKIVLPNDMNRLEQNEYMVSWDIIGEKKILIREFFQDGQPVDDTFRLNYMSATGDLYPKTVAAGIATVFAPVGEESATDGGGAGMVRYPGTNEIVLEFSDGCLGIVFFDFIGEDAIAHVVGQQGNIAPTWIG